MSPLVGLPFEACSLRGFRKNMFVSKNLILVRSLLIAVGTTSLLAGSIASVSFAAPNDSAASPKTQAKPGADKDKDKDKKDTASKPTPEPVIENVVNVSPEDLVNKPHDYLGKNVKFNGNFFAFSTLALDYKPAFRSSKTHISMLILRNGSHIPLSELKLAMMMPKDKDPDTQTLGGLKDGDQIEVVGKVFSTALDDPWVEILKLKKIGGKPDDKKTASAAADDKKTDTKADSKAGDKEDKSKSEGKSPAKN